MIITGYNIGAFVSANTLAAILAACVIIFVTAIGALIRSKKKLQTQLANYKSTVKYNVASDSKSAAASMDTNKNVAYEPNPPGAVDIRKNVAYEPNSVAVDTKKNISYTVHTPSK